MLLSSAVTVAERWVMVNASSTVLSAAYVSGQMQFWGSVRVSVTR